MKKYFAVAQILFKAQLAYRFDVIMTALSTVWRVIFAVILWRAIFENREQVGGFTLAAMLSYYVVSSFLATADLTGSISGEVANRILGGTFSKYMVIPSDPRIHFLAQTLGAGGFYAIFAVIAAAVSTLVFRIDLVITYDLGKIILALAMYLLGLVFMGFYQFFLGIFAFKFQDVGFVISHVLPNLVSFLRGEMVPLSLLPDAFAGLIRFLPFTHGIYTPSMLLTGGADLSEGFIGLAVLAFWTLAMALISHATYQRMRVKYEGVGI